MADKNTNVVRKDAFNVDTKTLKDMEASGSYTSAEQDMINELKRLLIQLIENGKGS